MKELQKRLEGQEEEAYVNNRFTEALVKRLTGLRSPALDSFMIQYRPTKEMLQQFEADYDYYQYIRDAGRSFAENWAKEHPEH